LLLQTISIVAIANLKNKSTYNYKTLLKFGMTLVCVLEMFILCLSKSYVILAIHKLNAVLEMSMILFGAAKTTTRLYQKLTKINKCSTFL